MSEDILSELTYDDWLETEPGWVNVPQPILDQAAEEITRLRARVEVLERACRLIQADPDPHAVRECSGCYRHSRLAFHALETAP